MERFFSSISDMSPGTRIALMGILIVVIGGFYYFVPYASYKKEVAKARKSAMLLRKRYNAEKRRQAMILKDEKRLSELQEKIKKLTKRLPSRVGMSELIGELDQMSEDISIRSIRPKEDDTQSIPMVVIKPIEFKVEGRFHSICRFLYKMFQMNRLMDVGDISMKVVSRNSKNSRGPSLIEAVFTARIYYAPLRKLSAKNGRHGQKGPDVMEQGMKRLTDPEAQGGRP